MAWAPYPGVEAGEPAHVTIGGIDLAVGAYSKHPQQAFEATLCLRRREPDAERRDRRPAARPAACTTTRRSRRPTRVGRRSSTRSSRRSVRPQTPGLPEHLDRDLPHAVAAGLRERERPSRRCGAASRTRSSRRGWSHEAAPPHDARRGRRRGPEHGAGRGRRPCPRAPAPSAGSAGCCAPRRSIIMVAVTAYPIVYAVYLSLQRYDLRFPTRQSSSGSTTTRRCSRSPYWWADVPITVIITWSRWPSSSCSAWAWHRDAPGDLRPGHGPHRDPVPYGIVTVVAAFSWQYAWTPGTGYLAGLLSSTRRR